MKDKQGSLFRLSVLVLVGLWFSSAAAFGYDPLRDYSRVDLEKLNKNPKTYKNTNVKFRVYFHQIDDVWSPFFSPFSPSDFVSFSAWDHEHNIWKKKDMLDDFPFLYIKNSSPEVNDILTANKYDYLELKGTVVSAFKSKPWVEVRHVEVLKRKVYTDQQLSKFMLANEASKNGHPTVATQHFEEGLKVKPLSPKDRAEVHKQLAINYFNSSDYQNAVRNVHLYREYASEEDPTLQSLLEKARKLQKMSPEERNAYEKKRWERAPGKSTGHLAPELKKDLDSTERLRKKYRTLLSKYEEILGKNQSLKTKQEELRKQNRQLVQKMKSSQNTIQELKQEKEKLDQKLTEAYKKNARLLAQLHEKNEGKVTGPSEQGASSGQETTQARTDHGSDGKMGSTNMRSDQLREKKLLSRIRTLKRRNRSLRSQMTSLSNQNREAQQQISRLRNQVHLETSSVDTTEASSTSKQEQSSTTSKTDPDGTQG